MKTSLKNSANKILFVFSLSMTSFMPCNSYAGSIIDDTFSKYYEGYGSDSALQHAIRTGQFTLSSGSINLNIPSVTISGADFFKIKKAHFSGGCNGIDWDFGGIDFINSDKAVKFIETFAQQAPMAIAYIVIQNLTDPIFSVITHIQEMAKKILSLSMNSCQAAMKLAKKSVGDFGKWDKNAYQNWCANDKVDKGDSNSQYDFFSDMGKSIACSPLEAEEYLSETLENLEKDRQSVVPAKIKTQALNALWEIAVINKDIKIESDTPYTAQSDKINIGRFELLMNLNTMGVWYVPSLEQSDVKDSGGLGNGFDKVPGKFTPQMVVNTMFCGLGLTGPNSSARWDYIETNSNGLNSEHTDILEEIKNYCMSLGDEEAISLDTEVFACGPGSGSNKPNLSQCVMCSENESYYLTIGGNQFRFCNHDKTIKGNATSSSNYRTPANYMYKTSLSNTYIKEVLAPYTLYGGVMVGIGPAIAYAFAKSFSNIDHGKPITENNTKPLSLLYENTPFDLWRLFNTYNIEPKYSKTIAKVFSSVLAKRVANDYASKVLFNGLGRIGDSSGNSQAVFDYTKEIKRGFKKIKIKLNNKWQKELSVLQADFSIQNTIMQRIEKVEAMLNQSAGYKMLLSKQTRGVYKVKNVVNNETDNSESTSSQVDINSIYELLEGADN